MEEEERCDPSPISGVFCDSCPITGVFRDHGSDFTSLAFSLVITERRRMTTPWHSPRSYEEAVGGTSREPCTVRFLVVVSPSKPRNLLLRHCSSYILA